MKKKRLIYTILALVPFLTGGAFFEQSSSKAKQGEVFFPEAGLRLLVEIAETERQRVQGLMHRPFLASDKGMMFIFTQDAVQKVWMKNTLIALDIVFISAENEVVSIIQDLKPCLHMPCPVYSSNKKAKYMLEVNAGTIEKGGVFVGQTFIIDGGNKVK